MTEFRPFQFANFARSTLAARLSEQGTSLEVAESTGDRFPNPAEGEIFSLVLAAGSSYEVLYCTARSGDVLTVERAKEGTTAAEFPANTAVVHTATAGFLERLAFESPAPSLTDQRIGSRAISALTMTFTFSPDGTFVTSTDGEEFWVHDGASFVLVDPPLAPSGEWVSGEEFVAADYEVRLTTNSGYNASAFGHDQDIWHPLDEEVQFVISAGTDPPQQSEWVFEIRRSGVVEATATYDITTQDEPVDAPESESFEVTTANGGKVYGFEVGVFGSTNPTPMTLYNGCEVTLMEGIGETGSGGFEIFLRDQLLPGTYTEVEIETDGGTVVLEFALADDSYEDPEESWYYWDQVVWNVGDIFSNPKTVTFR